MNKYLKYVAAVLLVLGVGFFAFQQYSAPDANAQDAGAAGAAGLKTAWAVRCNDEASLKAENKRGKCEMYQRQDMKDSGQRVIEFAIGYPAEQNNARGIFILPMGILLQPGVKLSIDDGKPLAFQVRYCLPNGCYAYVSLNDDLMDRLSKGNQATVEVIKTDGQPLRIPVPLKGFTKALDQVQG
tara:strand:+ start:160 stop:711 length:552 start_codon:yes stop_codon:yes gene_type:complete